MVATTDSQKASLSELPDRAKLPLYEAVTLSSRAAYFSVSCRPLTIKAEDDMELLSDLVTWGERFTNHFPESGVYVCAQCSAKLFLPADKWSGPCPWPSWRRPAHESAISLSEVEGYNEYTCEVCEL